MKETMDVPARKLAAFGGSLAAVFLLLAISVVVHPQPNGLDVGVRDAIQRANPDDRWEWGNTQTSRVVDAVAVAVLDGIIVLLAWRHGGLRTAAIVALSFVLFYGSILTLKLAISRPRPDDAFSTTGAFPSGHAAHFALALYFLTFIVLPLVRARRGELVRRERWVPAAIALSVAFGFYRVFVGEHWVTDVAASLVYAPAWALATQYAIQSTTMRRLAPEQIPNG